MSEYVFHDIDPIQKRLVMLADDLGYLVLAEVTGRNTSEKLARVDLTPEELRSYLVPPPARAARDDDRDEDEPDHDPDNPWADENDEPAPTLASAVASASPVDLVHAGMRWLMETAGAQMNSTKRRKFKLSAWSPKGDRLLFSARFSAENPDWDASEDDDAPEAQRQPPTLVPASSTIGGARAAAAANNNGGAAPPPERSQALLMLEALPEGRVWKALGGGYEHLLGLYERGFGGLSRLQNDALESNSKQGERAQRLSETLAERLVAVRLGDANDARESRERTEPGRVNEELAKTFIQETGAAVRAYAAMKAGIPPEMAEFVDLLASSPQLREFVANRKVIAMLRDEGIQKELIASLTLAANAPETPSTPPPPQDQPKAA